MKTLTVDKQYEQTFPNSKLLFVHEGIGTTSRKTVKVTVYLTSPGSGIQFVLFDPKIEKPIKIAAIATNVVNTLRNVTIGSGNVRLCLVEHFLAAAGFCNVFDIDVVVDGPELPLGDGSAMIWLDLFSKAGYLPVIPDKKIKLTEPIFVSRGDRQLLALPSSDFSMTYLMDWNHPAIGRGWGNWNAKQSVVEIARARTFGSKKEHDLLGIGGEAVSFTEAGFDKPLYFEDEPLRHKLLDLFGDLVLSGFNPLSFQAQFVSIKGGHEMDVDLAKQLKDRLECLN